MSTKLLTTLNPFTTFVRFSRFMGPAPPGYVKYPGGIKYYPRHPEEKDPEITPAKLFRVERIKGVKGLSQKIRRVLELLKIHEKERVTIVKNIPEMNASLWKVKHLVKISPIFYPYGEPTENDINHTVLRENGECIVSKDLLAVNPLSLEAREKFRKNPYIMSGETIEKDCRDKWVNPIRGGY